MPEQGHILQVVVRERGKIAGQWWEVSEQGINTLGHTEQKLLRRIGFLGPEVSIEMRGIFPPCPWAGGCMNTLQLAAESGAKVTYRQLNGATYMFQREGTRRLDWDAASGWFK
jgi:hypothetical protein